MDLIFLESGPFMALFHNLRHFPERHHERDKVDAPITFKIILDVECRHNFITLYDYKFYR